MSSVFEIGASLTAIDTVAQDVASHARVVFRGLLLIGGGISGLRAAVLGSSQDIYKSIVLAAVCCGILETYETTFTSLVGVADSLSAYFRDQAGVGDYFSNLLATYVDIFREDKSNFAEKFLKMSRSGTLAFASMGVHWFAWLACLVISAITSTFMAVLYILGPLWVACGVFRGGEPLRQFIGAIIRIGLWNVVPSIALLIITKTATQSTNISQAMAINSALAIGILLSPFIVQWMLARGPAALGEMAFAGALGIATRTASGMATGLGVRTLAQAGAAAAGSAATGGQGGAAGVSAPDASPPRRPVGNPAVASIDAPMTPPKNLYQPGAKSTAAQPSGGAA